MRKQGRGSGAFAARKAAAEADKAQSANAPAGPSSAASAAASSGPEVTRQPVVEKENKLPFAMKLRTVGPKDPAGADDKKHGEASVRNS